MHVDAIAAQLVSSGPEFDVIVTENMLGDILSDLTGELAESLGIAPSFNHCHHHAMAQAAHSSAPDIAGRNVADPIAIILSAAMLLQCLGDVHDDPDLRRAATLINDGTESTVAAGTVTPDLCGNATTSRFPEAVLAVISQSN